MMRCGAVRCGAVWSGAVRCGAEKREDSREIQSTRKSKSPTKDAERCGAVRRGAVRRKEEDGQQRERANGGIKSVQDTGYIRIPCILYRYNLYHTIVTIYT